MKTLSVVIPAHNEEGSLEQTIRSFHSALKHALIPHEILVVNDNSADQTENIIARLEKEIHELKHVNNVPPNGFGFAVRCGLNNFKGDCVAIVMADMSDRPEDLVAYYRKLEQGYDCVFGSRFIKGGKVINYPALKYFLNRTGNFMIRALFGMRYNDTTNAFKLFSRETIEGIKPFISNHFNLTVELPLKAIVRGYSYTVVPNWWTNRKTGMAKFKIKEMGSRYFFIIIYCLLEKLLVRSDYHKKF